MNWICYQNKILRTFSVKMTWYNQKSKDHDNRLIFNVYHENIMLLNVYITNPNFMIDRFEWKQLL